MQFILQQKLTFFLISAKNIVKNVKFHSGIWIMPDGYSIFFRKFKFPFPIRIGENHEHVDSI